MYCKFSFGLSSNSVSTRINSSKVYCKCSKLTISGYTANVLIVAKCIVNEGMFESTAIPTTY